MQPALKRQSAHVTITLPLPSTDADGSELDRIPPGSVKAITEATVTAACHVSPPSIDRHEMIDSIFPDADGTTTFPLGCTNGWPPIQESKPAVVLTFQVNPPYENEDLMRNGKHHHIN